jgi:Spy/CpxP family protein refolding chaperone
MKRSTHTLSFAAVLALSLTALSAHAADTDTATQAVNDTSGSYGTDATDRGGRPSGGDQDNSTTSAILDWLTGLMD